MTCALVAKGLTKVFMKPLQQPSQQSSFKKIALKFFSPSKSFPFKALDNINFEVKEGESVALLGPNGAGKSTLIKLSMGILAPTKGYLELFGKNPFQKRKICAFEYGAVFGHRTMLWKHVPVIDSFLLEREIYNIPKKEFDSSLDELCKMLDIEKHLSSLPTKLSLGERIRCELAATLLHKPRILFLDEPTIGLDIQIRYKIRDFLRKMQKKLGITIILSSHEIADVEMISDRVIILLGGRIIFDSTPEVLREKILPIKIIRITMDQQEQTVVNNINLLQSIQSVKDTRIWKKENNIVIELVIDSKINPLNIIDKLPKDLPIMDISIQDPTLEEVIMKAFTISGNA